MANPEPADPQDPVGGAEVVRQLIHILSGLWAFVLPYSGWMPLFALAVTAIGFNSWILPRTRGPWLWRSDERHRGSAPGVVLYPLTVAILLVVFRNRPEVAAAGWGLLAFADGCATLVGRAFGRRRLPWNPGKTWAGSATFLAVGWLAVYGLVSWTVPGAYSPGFLVGVAGLTALSAACLESAPQRLDDNLSVPLLAALVLICALETEQGWQRMLEPLLLKRLVIGAVVNMAFAAAAYAMATLDRRGAIVGAILGTLVFVGLSWPGLLVLGVFFVLGSYTTRLGRSRKQRLEIGSIDSGERRAGNAVANGGIAALCAVFATLTPHLELFTLAFVGSMAAAAADTVESEIGSAWGRPTLLITSLQPVAPGTDGGVSLVGTLSGLAGSLVLAAVAAAGDLLDPALIFPMAVVAVLATLLESVAGATLERSGLLDNEGINLLNTLLGALAGGLVAMAVAS